MPKVIALLRGINVGGQKPVPMAALRACIKPVATGEPLTYVQSGNVVFETPTKAGPELRQEIERRIKRQFGFPVVVLLRTPRQLAELLERNPYLKSPNTDRQRLYVVFLADRLGAESVKRLEKFKNGEEHFEIAGDHIYLHYPLGYGRAKLNNNVFERVLSVQATTRNWKTVTELVTLASS